jgi:hypothetical protein
MLRERDDKKREKKPFFLCGKSLDIDKILVSKAPPRKLTIEPRHTKKKNRNYKFL